MHFRSFSRKHNINTLVTVVTVTVTVSAEAECSVAVSWLLMPYTLPRPSWCGYMQTVCQGEHLGVSGVEILSVFDLSPSDDDCIYSTLSFVIQQAKMYGVITPCITFDPPLYMRHWISQRKWRWTL